MDLPEELDYPAPHRGVFCNRTLNIRSLPAVGFDMDYTLVHYRTEEWEREAYEHVRQRLAERGWPVSDLTFDPQMVMLGLILDLELGNVVKANRFGFVKKAMHGTEMLDYANQKKVYARVPVDLGESRWVFLNTLFGMSEGCLFAQAVELLDAGKLPGIMGYRQLHDALRECLDETHVEGTLKEEILSDPDRYAHADEELPLALLDMKHAGKKLLLITNSEWFYTKAMMEWALDPHLPGKMTWRELFDIVVVSAGKPGFFQERRPIFEVVDDEGSLKPVRSVEMGKAYLGGHAGLIEEALGLPGEDILYVGDHIFADVNMSKSLLRWRTALVVRELEDEINALEAFKPNQAALSQMMDKKETLEHQFSQLRLQLQRIEKNYGPKPKASPEELRAAIQSRRNQLVALDQRIAPLAIEASRLTNERWGLLMRAGNDKSHLARQIEKHADIYTSRVSNLLVTTPFVYFRSLRGSLPHDSGPTGGQSIIPKP